MGEPASVRYAHNGDVSIAYTVTGSGPMDLLFVPGFVSHLDILWSHPLARRFLDRLASFARVITFDKRGQGLSDSGAYVLEDVVADAIAVLDAVGVEKAAVFGVSEGGSAATMLAATHPRRVTALAQLGTSARMSQADDYPQGIPIEAIRQAWAWLLENWGEGAGVEMFAPSIADDRELREWWSRLQRSGASPSAARTMAQMYEELDIRPLLGSVSAPTLVLWRKDDAVIPAGISRTVAEGIPGAKAVELPGADHMFLAGDQAAVLDEVEAFFTGATPAVETKRVLATVLFVDIVGSTARASELGDRRWRELLEGCDRIWRREVGRFRGRLIKSTGDGLLATFDGPSLATRAALAIRDASRAAGVELRAGVHTGECELMGDDVGGIAVHIASRVESSAPAGGVAATGTVKDLVIGSGLSFASHGTHELKGVPGAWQLYLVEEEAAVAAPA